MKTLLLSIITVVIIVALSAGGFVLFEYGKKQGEKKTTSTTTTQSATASAASSEEVINKIIRDCVLGMAAPSITDVTIDKKYYYTDASKTQWIRFHVSPIPQGSADPAYGVMKKVTGGKWTVVDFGTAGVEDNLPTDVKKGLEFN
jgi:hypothetical protein